MRVFIYIVIITAMASLGASIDKVFHPDIPFFDTEHTVMGVIVAAVTTSLILIIHFYMRNLEKTVEVLKKKELELQTEQNKLKSILDVMETGITIRNRDYELTYQNSYTENIFGNNIGEKCHNVFQNRDDVCEGCPVEKAFSDGETHSSIRKVITPKGETTFWENTAVPIRNAAGEIETCLEVNNNISERKNIENKIFEIEKLEQGRIGRDLHDDLGQVLTGVSFKTKVLRDKIADQLPVELDEIEAILRYLNDCKERTRTLAQGLMSLDSEEWNLARSLQSLARNTEKIFQISCEFQCNNLDTIYDQSTGTHLYRIAQEAVTNAVKHASPEHIEISLDENNGKSILTIKDDGSGNTDQLIKSTGLGKHIMNHRADIIGASLDIQSDEKRGTKVTCFISQVIKEES